MSRALVTGGTKGIGAAIAAALGAAGHEVFTVSRSTGHDVTQYEGREQIRHIAQTCQIIINNVGGGGRYGTYDEVMDKNVRAMIELTEFALPEMMGRVWGRVIAIGSIYGHREVGAPRPIFHAAKAAQAAWMKAMSKDMRYARRGITFNTVCPGNVRVAGKPSVDESLLPMGRMGTPEDVAKMVAFLCSDAAALVNGSTLVIDGGESNAI